MQLFSISNAFSGEWFSTYHDIKIDYNENVWQIIEDHQEQEDTLVGFFDKNDGSTFLVRVQFEEGISEVDDSIIESVLVDTLRQSDPSLQVIERLTLNISGKRFYSVDYSFSNKKYGDQLVRHAFLKRKNYAIILMFAWPKQAGIPAGKSFPAKHLPFTDGIQL